MPTPITTTTIVAAMEMGKGLGKYSFGPEELLKLLDQPETPENGSTLKGALGRLLTARRLERVIAGGAVQYSLRR